MAKSSSVRRNRFCYNWRAGGPRRRATYCRPRPFVGNRNHYEWDPEGYDSAIRRDEQQELLAAYDYEGPSERDDLVLLEEEHTEEAIFDRRAYEPRRQPDWQRRPSSWVIRCHGSGDTRVAVWSDEGDLVFASPTPPADTHHQPRRRRRESATFFASLMRARAPRTRQVRCVS